MAKRYERVVSDLRQQILSGTLAPGERLLSEETLATQQSVSLPTLRQALGVLQAEGLIEKRHGIGNFVREPRQRIEYANDRHWHGKPPAADPETVVSVTIRDIAASAELAGRLGVPPGTRLVEYAHHSHSAENSAPHSIARSYLVRDTLTTEPHTAATDASPWGDEFRSWLTASSIDVHHIIERLTARPPTPGEAWALGIAPGVSVLATERMSFDASGRVVEGNCLGSAVACGDVVSYRSGDAIG